MSFLPHHSLLKTILITTALAAVSPVAAQWHDDPARSGVRYYTVQLGSYGSSQEATASIGRLQEANIPDITTLPAGENYRVQAGVFGSYPDALLFRDSLPSEIRAAGPFIVPFESTRELVPSRTLQVEQRFFAHAPASLAELPTGILKTDVRYLRLEEIDREHKDDSYKIALQDELYKTDGSDAMLGYLHVNLGIQAIKQSDLNTALLHLKKVAEREVPSTAEHYVMALRRVAWITHQQGDRIGAYHAYTQIRELSQSTAVKAICAAEISGLLLELAESGKGNMIDVRQHIRRFHGELPGTNTKQRALLEMMYFETYARQKTPNYEVAARLSAEYVERWDAMGPRAPKRELAAAIRQAGMYHRMAGQLEKAHAYYDRVLQEFPDDAEAFAGHHPHAQALIGKAHVSRLQGDDNAARALLRDVEELYPGDLTVRKMIEIEKRNLTAEGGATE